MPNPRYISGYNFERKVKKDLEDQGYFVIRSAGSHSLIDLVALKPSDDILIQCKRNGKVLKDDMIKLKRLAKDLGTNVQIALNNKGRIEYSEVK